MVLASSWRQIPRVVLLEDVCNSRGGFQVVDVEVDASPEGGCSASSAQLASIENEMSGFVTLLLFAIGFIPCTRRLS